MKFLLYAAALIVASTATAQVVSVRSGDHATFTRLVLTIVPGADWQIGRIDGGYAIQFAEAQDGFDIDEVFSRIGRSRLADLAATDRRLDMSVDCNCHLDAFIWQPDKLVIDIIEGSAFADSAFESPLDPPLVEFSAAPAPDETTYDVPVLPLITDRIQHADLTDPIQFSVPPDPSGYPQVAEAERAIMESLARAASQGILAFPQQVVPFTDPSEAASRPPAPLVAVTDPNDGVSQTLPGLDGQPGPGLTLRTGFEREGSDAGRHDTTAECLPDDSFDVANWVTDEPFADQMGLLRRDLTGEFDAYAPDAIEHLARAYIGFGFGQEAQQVLGLDGKTTRERLVLASLAQIVDGTPVPGSIFADQGDCNGYVRLWSVLAAGTVEGVDDVGRQGAIMAFRVLPDPLRGHLGQRLAQIFVDAGDPETAESVLQAARPLVTGGSVDTDLTSAAVTEQIDGPRAAIAELDAIAQSDSRMTASGLADLMDLMVAEGVPVPSHLLDLAAALRFETGPGPDTALLAEAEIRALAAQNAFDEALVLLVDADVPLTQEVRDQLLSETYSGMTASLDDPAFLTHVFETLPEGLSAETENALATRLLGLGFPERALELTRGPAERETMTERRYLRAEAAGMIGDLESMEAALSGQTDQRAQDIRARAFEAKGEHRDALAQELLVPGTTPDPALAWRAGAWTLLETGDDPLLQTASRAVLDSDVPATVDSTLSGGRALLQQAEEARAMTDELLARFAVSEDGDVPTP